MSKTGIALAGSPPSTALDRPYGMTGGIVVFTHNGKLPSEGGKRIGYGFYTTRPVVREPEVVGPPEMTKDEYLNLRRAAHTDGECVDCSTFPNETQKLLVGGVRMDVVVCRNCGEKMQPRKMHGGSSWM